jgi:hypothetical protein
LKLEVEKLTRKLKKMSEKLSDNSRDDGTKPHPMGNKEVTSTRFAI